MRACLLLLQQTTWRRRSVDVVSYVLAGVDPAVEGTRDVLARNAGHPGHVFNLGHGVMPAVDPDVLSEVVKVVHTEGTVGPRPGNTEGTGRS